MARRGALLPFLVLAISHALPPSSCAEPLGKYLYVTPFAGYTVFDKDMRDPDGVAISDGLYYGGRIGFQALRWMGIEGALGMTPTDQAATNGKKIDFLHGSGALAFTPYAKRRGGPFVLVGYGGSQLKFTSGGERIHQANFELGVGAQLWFNDVVGVRVEARDLAWLPRDEPTDPKTHSQIYGAGISFAIGGRARDSDADGVPDRDDRCPSTPKGALADATGCPHDSDGDGVLDGLDACVGTPQGATVDDKGCPRDSDGDTILDGIDQCADTPANATVDPHGCPHDSDGDGVSDGLDQCANTPKGATVDDKGCPSDADNDGIPDGVDQCPSTSPGLKVDERGCPIEVNEKETELLDTGMIRLSDVNFETGKAKLLPESLPPLDQVGVVLGKWPELKIEIGGHSDSRGSTAYNQKLSEQRVNAVLDYMLQKYPNLSRNQYVVVGYGESKPLVPNTSPLNMAKNRRVEFKVLNKDVLKREVEHRKLLENR